MPDPLVRLVLTTLTGGLIGLSAWALLDDAQPGSALRPLELGGTPPGDYGEGFAPADDVREGPLTAEEARRDTRPPHAPRVPATPPRLEIPAIKVRAHVAALGTTASGALDVPDNWSVVGRWRGGSRPGDRGVAVLVGHVDSQSRPAVFHHLGELQQGDLIRFVPRTGRTQEFVVVRKRRTSKQRFPTPEVYEETPRPTLRLITCGGEFDWSRGRYKDNVIVYAEKI